MAATFLYKTLSAETSALGVAILIHGLNNRPQLMQPWAMELNALGYHAVLVHLSGHRANPDCWQRLDYAELWRTDLASALSEVKKEFPDLPVSLWGYSLGATLILDYLLSNQDPRISQAILLAPAVALNLKTRLLHGLLQSLLPNSINYSIPSRTPKKWRRHESTSIHAYRGLFRLIAEVKSAAKTLSRELPPLAIIVEPRDELVHYQATRLFFSNYFPSANIHSVESTAWSKHMIADPEELTAESVSAILGLVSGCI